MFLHLRCAVLEKGGKLPLSLLSLSKGSGRSFPSMKGVYGKKGAEQDPTRTKCLQWMTPSLSTHCHLTQQDTGPTHPCAVHTRVPLQPKQEELEMHIPGQDLAPSQVTGENSAFPQMPDGMGTAKHGPRFRAGCDSAGHQSWAPPAHEECVGHTGTALLIRTSWKRMENWTKHNSLKPGLTRKAVSHWRSTSTRRLLLMIDNCIQGLRLIIKTHR